MKYDKDSLGTRMKSYESVSNISLTPRSAVIIRIDGKAFHTYTKGFEKPFDSSLMEWMENSAIRTAQEMQGFKLAYTQSDECSFLITDFDTIQTQGWFNYELSKIVSISASVFTACFNDESTSEKLAFFDSRAFVIPQDDISNYFLWRTKDCERNSLSSYCQSLFSHKQLHGKKKEDMHEMLHGIGKNWTTDLKDKEKNGTFVLPDFSVRNDVKANFIEVNQLVQSVLKREETA